MTDMTTPALRSTYELRQMADSLRAFGVDSALRQIGIHVARNDINDRDADYLRNLVTNSRLWLY